MQYPEKLGSENVRVKLLQRGVSTTWSPYGATPASDPDRRTDAVTRRFGESDTATTVQSQAKCTHAINATTEKAESKPSRGSKRGPRWQRGDSSLDITTEVTGGRRCGQLEVRRHAGRPVE